MCLGNESLRHPETNIFKWNGYIKPINNGVGVDRAYRPYYIAAKNSNDIIVTEPYLSTSSYNLCISTALKHIDKSGRTVGILVIDINLAHAIEFLMGDRKRKKFHPFFTSIYSCISIGLFFIVAILLYSAANEIFQLFFI